MLSCRMMLPAVLAPCLALTGCIDFADFGDSDRYKEDFHYSYPLNSGGSLSLENMNGSVEIMGWDQNTVDVNGTKYASNKSILSGIRIDASASPAAVRIRTERPNEVHGGGGARYTIHVPRAVVLDTIATTNGSIRVEDVNGNARLKSSNGTIRVQQLRGELDAVTTNGAVEAQNLDGNATVHTSNGSIKIESGHGSVDATTTNGAINAALTDPSASWPLKLRSSNGHIDLRLKTAKIPDVRAETTVHLPEGTNARLRAVTTHANVDSDFEVNSVQGGSRSKSELEGSIGSGGSTLELTSTNGSIHLVKN